MPKFNMDGFISAFESVVEGMEAGRAAAAPKLRGAVEKWSKDTAEDATAILSRPRWLLSKNITSKVKEYQKSGKRAAKIWAMAGFKFTEKDNKRSPGYYGQFHEAGWRPGNYRPSAPKKFLRQAKLKNLPELEKESEKALTGICDIVAKKMQETRTQK